MSDTRELDDASFDNREADEYLPFKTLLANDLVRWDHDSGHKLLKPFFRSVAEHHVELTWPGRKWDRFRGIDYGVADDDDPQVEGFTWVYGLFIIYWTPE